MAGDTPSRRTFEQILEEGATVDDIFKDSPAEGKPVEEIADLFGNEGLQSANRRLAATEQLFKLLNRDCTFGELISLILRVAMEQVKSEAGSFFEVDHEKQNLFFRAVTGRSSESLLATTVPLGSGVVGFVCENQQPMDLANVEENKMYLKSIGGSVGFEAKNVVAYPIIIRGATFGCIELLNRLGEECFTDADKEVLSTICEYAAKIIENRLVLASMSNELEAYRRRHPEDKAA